MSNKSIKHLYEIGKSEPWKYLCHSCHQGFNNLSAGEIPGDYPHYCPHCYSTSVERTDYDLPSQKSKKSDN
jgi:rRNA maturation endonuclease Nob1